MKFQPEKKWWAGSKWPPREWQAQALPKALASIRAQAEGEGEPRPVIRAVMGAGKSVLISEVIKQCPPDRGEVVVVTAPTQKLVRQLSATIANRVGVYSVGQFYANRKDSNRQVIVACMDSASTLAEALGHLGKRVGLLIADECHRTEAEGFLEAAEELNPISQLGFTATPWRSESGKGLSLWDTLIHDYGPTQAIADGVVVPWLVKPWKGDLGLSIDQICLEQIESAVKDRLGPGVVNAISVDDAEDFAAQLRERDVKAQAIHYQISDHDQERLLRELERGDLNCLVHVSLLQEGVDMPWLMWGCLRRKVQSTIRFPQEVGRFLRAHPGKERAILFDPHGLFGQMKISLEAVLSGDIEEDEDKPPIELALEEVEEVMKAPQEPRSIGGRPEVMDGLGAYIRQLVVAFDAAGIIDQRVRKSRWREDPPTDKQISSIWKVKWVLNTHFIPEIPMRHRAAMAWAVEHREFLNKGQASDLLDVLFGMKTVKRWPELAERMAEPEVA